LTVYVPQCRLCSVTDRIEPEFVASEHYCMGLWIGSLPKTTNSSMVAGSVRSDSLGCNGRAVETLPACTAFVRLARCSAMPARFRIFIAPPAGFLAIGQGDQHAVSKDYAEGQALLESLIAGAEFAGWVMGRRTMNVVPWPISVSK